LAAEPFGFRHHALEHLTDPGALLQHGLLLELRYVIASQGRIHPMLRFGLFSIRIRELANEMGEITLLPGFR